MLLKKYSLLATTALFATTVAQFAPDPCDNCLIQNMRQVANCGSASKTWDIVLISRKLVSFQLSVPFFFLQVLRSAALVSNPASYTPEERQCVCALASNRDWVTNCHACDGYVILMLTTQLAVVQSEACATELPTVPPTTRTSSIATTSTSTSTSTITSTQPSGTTTALPPAPPSNTGSGANSLKTYASVVVAAIAAWAFI